MPLEDAALPVPRKVAKHLPEVAAQLFVQRPATALRDKDHMVFTFAVA